MAATALSAPAPEHIEIWNRFQSLAEGRVREGNAVAGERLWEIVKSPDAAQMTIRFARDPADSVVCMLDLGSRVLTCSPGSAIASDPLAFHLPGSAGGRLRREEHECTLEQAVTLILDQLIWIEDGGRQSEDAPEVGPQ